MKKNNKTIMIIIIVGILLLITGLLISKLWKKPQKKAKEERYLTATEELVYNCKNTDDVDCIMDNEVKYKFYSYDNDINSIKYLIDQFNTLTTVRLDNDKKDLMTNYPECEEYYDKYLYRHMTTSFIYYYEDSTRDIISISNETTTRDYCTDTVTETLDVYTYSKKYKDFIKDEYSMFEAFGYSKEEINEMIVKYSKKYYKTDVDVSKIKEYRLLYDNYGQLVIQYKTIDSDKWLGARNRN